MTSVAAPFVVVDVPQRSPEWFASRCGRLTSSMVDKVFRATRDVQILAGKEKGSESVQRRNLRLRLACERLTGASQDTDSKPRTSAMQRGVDRESDAREAWEVYVGRNVYQAGFLSHTELMVGASLDGYVGEFEGFPEIKCPETATHVEYLRGLKADPGWLPLEYLPQIRHQFWVSGAQWCDFVSFDDRMPARLQLLVRRIERFEVDLEAHEKAVKVFLSEVEKEMDAIRELAA